MQIPVALLYEAEKNSPFNKAETHKFLKKVETAKAPELDSVDQVLRRRSMIAMVAPEDVDVAFERYLGNNDLLPLNYLQLGFLKSHAVGRIRYFDTEQMQPAVATGFLISPDLIVTNNHVFPSPDAFQDAFIEFDFYYDINGNEKEKITFQLSKEKLFYSNTAFDICLIGIEKKDTKGVSDILSRGYLVLNPVRGKAGNGDYAAIIEHPEGQPMQIGIRENKFLDVDNDPNFIYYSTDTSQGSSGSPVFNDQWQLIGLHSAGTASKNANGNFLDKDNKIIPIDPVTQKLDGSRIVWINNRGIRVSAIWSLINTDPAINNHPFILNLRRPNYSDERAFLHLSLPPVEQEKLVGQSVSTNTPTVPEPAILPSGNNLHFHFHIGSNGQVSLPSLLAQGSPNPQASLQFEKKIENEVDYSTCQGYDSLFMGVDIPFPTLSDSLKKKIAFLVDNPNAYVLKYHHYSSIHHAVRRMPVVSAINISGNSRFKELSGREDNWFRDRRIDFDVQLNDEFYLKSKMDRGHMSRREDAEWGNSVAFAETAAIMTCCYTNACPQVPALNRFMFGFKGEWGELEGLLLEKGVKKQKGSEAKISVFNGPIFQDDDPVFKGIQVPMDYFKIAVWIDEDLQIRSTGYVLSQKALVSDVDFEALHLDQIFSHRQVSIKEIEERTQLKFEKVRDLDTN